MKSNPGCGIDNRTGLPKTSKLTNIVFEDVVITKSLWWSVWIGPQQQHEPDTPLGDMCSLLYPVREHCPTQGCADFRNITLRRVIVDRPYLSPGVILGNESNPMRGFVFDHVEVRDPGMWPYNGTFVCRFVEGESIESRPTPECMAS